MLIIIDRCGEISDIIIDLQGVNDLFNTNDLHITV